MRTHIQRLDGRLKHTWKAKYLQPKTSSSHKQINATLIIEHQGSVHERGRKWIVSYFCSRFCVRLTLKTVERSRNLVIAIDKSSVVMPYYVSLISDQIDLNVLEWVKNLQLNFVNYIKSSLKTRDKVSCFLYMKAYTQHFIISIYYHKLQI